MTPIAITVMPEDSRYDGVLVEMHATATQRVKRHTGRITNRRASTGKVDPK